MITLGRLCIDVMAEHFERFYFAFTENQMLQEKFEVLQRRFSVEFLKALYNHQTLKEKYFDLLINEHLNYLKGKWLENTIYLNSTADIFRRLPNLTRIRFKNCGDEILQNVATCLPNIVEINVNESNVTDNGVQFLCRIENGVVPCPKLKNIFVDETHVTQTGVENLIRNLRSLEKIYHPDVPRVLHSIHEENIQFNLVELEFFELDFVEPEDYRNFTDVLTRCLTVCPKLEKLICYILEEQHLILFNNTRLKKLCLEFRMEGDRKANMDNFLKAKGGKLTFLDVAYCSMSVYILGKFCPNLKEFRGRSVDFTDDNNNLELNFASLTDCELVDIEPSINEAVCLLISSPPKLETILLSSCNISLEMKTHILKWCEKESAKKITLTHSFQIILEMEFLKDILSTCKTLEKMTLSSISLMSPNEMETAETLKGHAKSLKNKPIVDLRIT